MVVALCTVQYNPTRCQEYISVEIIMFEKSGYKVRKIKIKPEMHLPSAFQPYLISDPRLLLFRFATYISGKTTVLHLLEGYPLRGRWESMKCCPVASIRCWQ